MDVNTLELESIDAEKAVNLSRKIIVREYQIFIDHLVWHEYKSLLSNRNPIITEDELLSKNQAVLKESFKKMENIFLVKIPLYISHTDFKIQMVQALKESNIL